MCLCSCSCDQCQSCKVKEMSDSVNCAVKALVCPKGKLGHMEKATYSPSCLKFCSDLCSVRCRGLCNINHNSCFRGVLPPSKVHCSSSLQALKDTTLNYVTFETRDVETPGKGKPYTTLEKMETPLEYTHYQDKLRNEFARYSEHIISTWFLRSNMIEAMSSKTQLQHCNISPLTLARTFWW